MVFPAVLYGFENYSIKKADGRRINAFELWCWRRLLRVPWTARRSNQSILKEISPGCSLEELMLKLKLQYFGHIMQRVDLWKRVGRFLKNQKENCHSVQFSCSVLSDSLWPHGLQHARLPCPSPTPRVYSNPCPLSRWCHPTISSSVAPFSSCLQSFPVSGSFPMR